MSLLNPILAALTRLREMLSSNQRTAAFAVYTDDTGAQFLRRQDGVYVTLGGAVYAPSTNPRPWSPANVALETGGNLATVATKAGSMDASLTTIKASIGTIGDAAYAGGFGTEIAIQKGIYSRLTSQLDINLPPNAAKETTQVAVLQALQSQSSSFWTDNSGAIYTRKDTLNGSGQTVVTYYDTAGNPVTPGAGLKLASSGASVTEHVSYWDVVGYDDGSGNIVVGGTGYSIGQTLQHSVLRNLGTSPPTTMADTWTVLDTGAVLAAPPVMYDLIGLANGSVVERSALPDGAATEATLGKILSATGYQKTIKGTPKSIPVSGSAQNVAIAAGAISLTIINTGTVDITVKGASDATGGTFPAGLGMTFTVPQGAVLEAYTITVPAGGKATYMAQTA